MTLFLDVKQMVSQTKNVDLTPQETEQLSQYAADDDYVQKQKEDIQELASYFKDMLNTKEIEDHSDALIKEFQNHFKPIPGLKASYKITVTERKKPLIIQINHTELKCFYGTLDKADVELDLNQASLNDIIFGRQTDGFTDKKCGFDTTGNRTTFTVCSR